MLIDRSIYSGGCYVFRHDHENGIDSKAHLYYLIALAVRRIDLQRANVARSNTIRDINRQIVLNYVRERGPISRSEIAHETALQRSTISLIMEALKAEGLIEEGGGESTGGRPPILLSLRTADPVAIGIDLGTVRTVL